MPRFKRPEGVELKGQTWMPSAVQVVVHPGILVTLVA
jgi:hypothetical protein